jgi:hypothetical protein
VSLTSGADLTAVFALGESGGPTLETFGNDFQAVAAGKTRLSVDYAGEGSPIQLVVKRANSNTTLKYTINPGGRQQITLPAGIYTIEATVGGVSLASETIGLPQRSVTLLFAVGNTANESLTFATRTIRDVF